MVIMFNIGDFARLAGVTVRMLRHYDSLGLLVPAHVDPVTGYRRYAAAQLPRLNRLVALKDLGLTLAQVGTVLDAQVSAEELRGMLTLRRAQIEDQMAADRGRLAGDRGETPDDREGGHHVRAGVRGEGAAAPPAGADDGSGHRRERAGGDRSARPSTGCRAGLAAAGVPTGLPSFAWYAGDAAGTTWGVGCRRRREAVDVEGAGGELPAVERALTVIHRGSMATIGDTGRHSRRRSTPRGSRHSPVGRSTSRRRPATRRVVTELQQPVR